MQILYGFLLAILISYLAYKAHSLNKSGAIAATFTGTIIFGIGGWQWAILLLTFFITSSALSRAFKKRKQKLEDEKFSKGSQRDAGQVLGNGGIATFFAGLNLFYPNEPILWLCFSAALAAVNADTWATELGVLNPNPPRMITNLTKIVDKGTSGGISLLGTFASLLASSLIAVLATFLNPNPTPFPANYFLLITMAGLAGSLFDSLLGGTVQAMYFCPRENKETEKHPLHTCGTPTVHIRGWKWLNNDLVNFACSLFAIGSTIILSML